MLSAGYGRSVPGVTSLKVVPLKHSPGTLNWVCRHVNVARRALARPRSESLLAGQNRVQLFQPIRDPAGLDDEDGQPILIADLRQPLREPLTSTFGLVHQARLVSFGAVRKKERRCKGRFEGGPPEYFRGRGVPVVPCLLVELWRVVGQVGAPCLWRR
jgi:hypothetical protein